MNTIKSAQAGTSAVKKLRLQNLKIGLPFMINSRDLPPKQCYIEYPDKKIKLVTISGSGFDFVVIRELSENESRAIRLKFDLIDA